jgi:hypothetical protein
VIAFVCWKWDTPGRARVFDSAHVNVLRAMVERHYPEAHRFICITDDPAGLDPRIEAIACPVHFADVASPSGARFPSCYRRLWVFSRQARELLGRLIFCLDIDCILLRDLRPLVARPEKFVGWCDEERFGWNKVAGGAYMLETGTMTHVWDDFDPARSPAIAHAAGNGGSDQGWMSYKLYPPPGRWSSPDLVKINWTAEGARSPPSKARIVFTSGLSPPWCPTVQRKYPWIRDHWKL